jgi:hypothetical protein
MGRVWELVLRLEIGGERLKVGDWRLEEVAGVAGLIYINSPVLFLFSFFVFLFSCFIFRFSSFIFQKYIRHEQCGFPQEDI